MIDRLRALHAHVERLKLRQERDMYAAGRNDALERALEVLEAAGFGPGTSTAADEIERLRAALHRIDDETIDHAAMGIARAALAGPAEEERG